MNPDAQKRLATDRNGAPRGALLALVVWLLAAVVIGATGLLARLPVPPPAVAGAITLSLLVAIMAAPGFRAEIRRFSLRSFVLFHLTRVAAGGYFLFLYARGTLPAEFALPAGWGDIIVGLAAAAVALSCIPIRTPWQRAALLTWNTLGLLDILFVLSTGVRLFLGDPVIMASFARLPLALLPTFVVPVVLVTHVLIFIWWRDARAAAQ